MNSQNKNNASTESIYGIIEKNKNKDYCFEIPAYQRLYEWGDSQIETLLDDCRKACEKGGAYFVGNVVVAKANEENKYVLIDGQQRLTTIFLIGIYLKSYFESQSESQGAGDEKSQWESFLIDEETDNLRISMPLREKEERSLKKFVENKQDFVGGGEEGFTKFANGFNKRLEDLKREQIHQNFIDALQCIGNWFARAEQEKKQKEEGFIKKFSNFLYGSVKFVLVELADTTDLNRFFVRMNNRGKQLEKHEILKARLLSVIQKENLESCAEYAKILDLCSDMDRYIFQRKSDREISKGDGKENTIDGIINSKDKIKKPQDESNQQDEERFKSIVDFPTFLLHTAKLYQLEKPNQPSSRDLISIDKDKLLELICVNNECGNKDAKKVVILKADEAQNFIKTLLKYRVLFDYFVIKRELKNQHEEEKNNSYRVLKGCYEDLAMVQNYLRVARSGDRQNHHHWLTAFLWKVWEVMKEQNEVTKKQNLDFSENPDQFLKKVIEFIKEQEDASKQENPLITKLVKFLEEWDTELAKLRFLGEQGDLIARNNELMIEFNKKEIEAQDDTKWEFLNRGTVTPHYWFYRLEYYLWKAGMEKGEDWSNFEIGGKKLSSLNIEDKDFSTIAKDYRFRNLNSIEHIWPQSKAGEWKNEETTEEKEIDMFGNLSLISPNFNSMFGNQDMHAKFSIFKGKQIKDKREKSNVESLKMWLAYCCMSQNEEKWSPKVAEGHQEQMLKILKESLEK